AHRTVVGAVVRTRAAGAAPADGRVVATAGILVGSGCERLGCDVDWDVATHGAVLQSIQPGQHPGECGGDSAARDDHSAGDARDAGPGSVAVADADLQRCQFLPADCDDS